MEVFIWLGIVSLFILSFIGIFMPIVPSIIAIWLGLISYHFFLNNEKLGIGFWLTMGTLSVVLLVAEFVMNRYFVDLFGGSRWSEWGAIIGIIIGVFVYPPVGIIVVPFVIVLLIELLLQQPFKRATFAATGALVGFLSSVVAKIVIQLLMIAIFFIVIIFM